MSIELPIKFEEESCFEKFLKRLKGEKLIYECPDEKRSCDKKGHAERSIANQPNHLKFWRKQNEN